MRPRHLTPVALLLVLCLLLAACSGAEQRAAPDDAAAPSDAGSPPPATTPTPTPPPTVEPAPSATPAAAALESRGVASGHPLASRAGMEVLEQGGNAVDAAVATAFADAVLTPSASGIGGGGVALVAADGVTANYDYRDVVNESGTVPDDGLGVPGFVAGMGRLHADHGSLPWQDLLEPATRLAREGVPVSGFLAGAIATGSGQRATGDLPQFRRESGGTLGEGDLLVQEDLAETMAVIAEEGPAAVYDGSLTTALAEVPGLDAESLAAYEVEVAEAAAGPVGDYTMVSASPPHPGAAIIQMVQVAEAGGIAGTDPGSAAFVDLQTRAWRVAQSSVEESIGDPAFVDVPVAELTDPERNAAIAADLDGAPQALAAGPSGSSAENTTHISVVDADGRAVSMTNTVTNYWGSGREVLGFFVNDSLERFDDIGDSDTNAPAPGRRSVTWSAPTMLLDDRSRPVLVLGTPGGQQIPNVIASVVTRWALHGEDLADVVPADRFFYDDGVLSLESSDLTDPLAALGWTVEVLPGSARTRFGSVQALAVDWDTGEVSGVADTRRSAGVETTGR
ncbi:gamma-glutamyltransferase [Jannaschia sp. R86511]|uniref:gamma-glutamyltransferase n=1 Tax=Jannaschia sp. R86511 TaxID=3093853 RepID=UPI0036D39947